MDETDTLVRLFPVAETDALLTRMPTPFRVAVAREFLTLQKLEPARYIPSPLGLEIDVEWLRYVEADTLSILQ